MKKSPKVGEKVFTFGYRDEMDMMYNRDGESVPLYGVKVTRKLPYTNNRCFVVMDDGLEYYCDAADTFVISNRSRLKKDSNGNNFFIHNSYIGYVKNNRLHREDGPALEYNETYSNHLDNIKWWMKKGYLHRENGPAYENPNNGKYHFYIDGCRAYSLEQFTKLIIQKDPKATIKLSLDSLSRLMGVKFELLPKL
jgi:hypothetical protein